MPIIQSRHGDPPRSQTTQRARSALRVHSSTRVSLALCDGKEGGPAAGIGSGGNSWSIKRSAPLAHIRSIKLHSMSKKSPPQVFQSPFHGQKRTRRTWSSVSDELGEISTKQQRFSLLLTPMHRRYIALSLDKTYCLCSRQTSDVSPTTGTKIAFQIRKTRQRTKKKCQ